MAWKRRRGAKSVNADLLTAAQASRKQIKGQIISITENVGDPQLKSVQEGLPAYIFMCITGFTQDLRRQLDEMVRNEFQYESETFEGEHKIRIWVDPKIVNDFGGGLTEELRQYLEQSYNAIFTRWNPPYDGDFKVRHTIIIADLQYDLAEKFSIYLGRRYVFKDTEVDRVVSGGGTRVISASEVPGLLIDRLA